MKLHRILKTFKGSQTGNDHHEFIEGTDAHLSDDLAKIAVAEGWAEPSTAEHRETKVIVPEETKPAKPFAKKGKK